MQEQNYPSRLIEIEDSEASQNHLIFSQNQTESKMTNISKNSKNNKNYMEKITDLIM
jgi:hypothetical protein